MIFTTLSGAQVEGTPKEMSDFFHALKIKEQQIGHAVELAVEPNSREATYYYSESRNELLSVQDMHTKHIFHALLHRISWSFSSTNTTVDVLSNLVKELYYRTVK